MDFLISLIIPTFKSCSDVLFLSLPGLELPKEAVLFPTTETLAAPTFYPGA